MVEHVGRDHLRTYLRTAYDLVRPGGAFLNHGISAQTLEGHPRKRETFIERYVFPDGELWPVGTLLTLAEEVGFEIRDVENSTRALRAHAAHVACRISKSIGPRNTASRATLRIGFGARTWPAARRRLRTAISDFFKF